MLALLKSFFTGLLQQMGFLNKRATIVLLGLDNAGKTTLQYKLKHGNVQAFVPTQRAKEEELTIGGVSIKAWDLGGHQAVRSL
jgi:GTPase SAR1 family protein